MTFSPGAALLLALLSLGTTAEHPVHASHAEAELNLETGALEVALKLDPADLERLLSKAAGRRLQPEDDPAAEGFAQAFLRESFQLLDGAKKPCPFAWTGMSVDARAAWLYFEFPGARDLAKPELVNRVLFDFESDQVNRVDLRVGRRRRQLVFAAASPRQAIDLSVPRPFTDPPDARRYDETLFICSHNAMAERESGWLFPCQGLTIPHQLELGVRALMIDLYEEEGRVMTWHSRALLGKRTFASVLAELKAFLDTDPDAILTLILEDHVEPAAIVAAFDQAGLAKLAWSQAKGEPWPTLGELRRSGRRLLVFTESGRPGTNWLMPFWEHAVETPWQAKTVEDLQSVFGRGHTGNRLFLVNHFISAAAREGFARRINLRPFLDERLLKIEKSLQRRPNFLALDFTEIGDAIDLALDIGARVRAPF